MMKASNESKQSLRIALDVGGTFTDVIVFDENSGEVVLAPKVSSNPKNLLDPVFQGLAICKKKFPMARLSLLLHGSTVGINTLLEEKGVSVGLITTKGFRDIYELARQWQGPRLYHLLEPKRKMYLSRANVFEVKERINHKGKVLEELDEQEVVNAARELISRGVQAIAIVFLFSFVNAEHEKKAKELIHELYPDLYVSISSEVNPEWREYERTCTTLANAYIGPKFEAYMKSFEEEVGEIYPEVTPLIMQSNGGVSTPMMLSKIPISTILSGPVAGVLGAKFLGDLIHVENLISLDLGGTSSDMSLIPKRILFQPETHVGLQTIRINAVDIHTIGAGGGSIARVEYGSVIKVGPQSAGADPGPACYGKGGVDPTLTDALVVLGYLDSKKLLKGEKSIIGTLSEKAVKEKIADPLHISTERAARGILDILVSNLIFQMRTITIERGYDPSDFTVVAFGGAGPTIVSPVAKELGIQRIIIPEVPGNFCAFGMHTADIYQDSIFTHIGLLEETCLEEVETNLRNLEIRTIERLKNAGMTLENSVISRFMDIRYCNQAYEITVPVSNFGSQKDVEDLRKVFDQFHTRRYGFAAKDEPIEIVNYRVRLIVPIKKLSLRRRNGSGQERPPGDSLINERMVIFDASCNSKLTPIYDRSKLLPGNHIIGPAIVEEYSSTTVLYPEQEARIDDYGNIIVSWIQ